MNIFYLDKNPKTAAEYHNDKHVVKMILESAQMLCTAHHVCNPINMQLVGLYKATHINHPSSLWVRDSEDNYRWLYSLFVSLCDEYTHRYGKTHLTDKKFRETLNTVPLYIDPTGIRAFSSPPLCMPDEYKCDDSVISYRNYYMGEKSSLAKWSKREIPKWWV